MDMTILDMVRQSPYSENLKVFEKLYPKAFEFIGSRTIGKKFVDIGGGNAKFVENFALANGASEYYNVDPAKHLNRPQKTNVFYVNSDIIEFLKSLEMSVFKKGVTFCLNGFELALLGPDEAREIEDNLEFMLLQVMQRGDIIFGVKSTPNGDISNSFSREAWIDHSPADNFFLFEKR